MKYVNSSLATPVDNLRKKKLCHIKNLSFLGTKKWSTDSIMHAKVDSLHLFLLNACNFIKLKMNECLEPFVRQVSAVTVFIPSIIQDIFTQPW